MTPVREYLATLPGRCSSGFAPVQHPRYCTCKELAPTDDYSLFRQALTKAVRADGTVHACDVRPLVRGRLAPKSIATCYRLARAARLLVEAGHERSDDEAGKNAGRMEPYYELRSAA